MKTIPTLKMVLETYPKFAAIERMRMEETYPKFAAIERMRMERPCEKTVESAVGGTRRLCEIGGLSLDEPVSALNGKRLEHILDLARCSELKPISVWSYLYSLRKLFAKWTRRYYADKKWTIPQIEMPSCRRQSPRYIRPDAAILAKTKEWYRGLEKRNDQREWVLATLMLEFAMRNGDAERLRWSDFRVKDGSAVLCYTRHLVASVRLSRRRPLPRQAERLGEERGTRFAAGGAVRPRRLCAPQPGAAHALHLHGIEGMLRAAQDLHRPHLPEVRRGDGVVDQRRRHPHGDALLRRPERGPNPPLCGLPRHGAAVARHGAQNAPAGRKSGFTIVATSWASMECLPLRDGRKLDSAGWC